MKRLSIVLLLLLSISAPAFAQTAGVFSSLLVVPTNDLPQPTVQVNGTTILYKDLLVIEKLGLGTYFPQTKLHIMGYGVGESNIRLSNTIPGGKTFEINPYITEVSNAGFEIYDVERGAAVITWDTTGAAAIPTGGSPNTAMCWKADAKTLGYCSTAIGTNGTCTCN